MKSVAIEKDLLLWNRYGDTADVGTEAASIGPCGTEKKRYSNQMSIAPTTTMTRYDALPSTSFKSFNSRDNPNATTHASKLMQIRLKVSACICRMMNAPIGTPITMLGTIPGISAM